MPPDTPPIVVVAAVVEREGRFLLTRRPAGTHLEGRWEFPGGKCEDDERHEDCLRRELLEELGVAARVDDEIFSIEHAYPERTVRLHFRRCRLDGDPVPQLGQQMRWATRDELSTLEFPDADRDLIAMLTGASVP